MVHSIFKDSRRDKIESYIVAIALFLLIPPYFMWGLPSGVGAVLVFVVFIVSLRHLKMSKSAMPYPVLLFLLLFIFYCRGSVSLLSILRLVLLLSMLFLERVFLYRIFKSFVVVYSVTMLPSLCEYALYLVGGRGFSGGRTIQPLNELKDYTYQAYLFFVSPNVFSLFPRYCSYYDEPGVVGTISAILLALNGYKISDRKNMIILISGILSLSLFFIVFTVIFFAVFYENRKLRKFTSLFSILAIVSLFAYLKHIDSPIIEKYVLERLAFDEDKGFAGNNRDVGRFSVWFKQYRSSSDYYLGLGRDAKTKYGINEGGASYKDLIVSYGIIGFLLYCALFFMWACRNYSWKGLMLFMFCFFSVLFQRPFIFSPIYFFLFLWMVTLIYYNKDKYESNCNLRSRKLCTRGCVSDT